jgi:threonylcarbamoyladenosine tRNA methylthiotransferase MtaB
MIPMQRLLEGKSRTSGCGAYPIDRLSHVAGYHVENFGCRASRADGEAIAAGLRRAGLSGAEEGAADVVILNTCSVTAEADRSARAYLRRVRRGNPSARVIVTGCYAQRAPEEVAALAGVDNVIGNSHKTNIVDVALAMISGGGRSSLVPVGDLVGGVAEPIGVSIRHDPLFAHSELAALPFAAEAGQTRPNLKVQDGCGNRCSFCVIPVTRGPSRSVSIEECLRAVAEFVESGGKELVLSGINLGRWGRELSPKRRFEDLVAAILERTRLPRLRISSVEPMDWSSELIDLFRVYSVDDGRDGPRLGRHAHLPLQSGSDTILRKMHRRYRPWHYAEKVEKIRAALPEAAIGADVMIGFPGETEALFRETYDFIARLPLTYLHLFPFSARPGTAAFRLHGQSPVHGQAVKERKAALRGLMTAKNVEFRRRLVGSTLPVVTLASEDSDRTDALSDNFVKVAVDGRFDANQLMRVSVTGLTAAGVCGELVSETRFQHLISQLGTSSGDGSPAFQAGR